MLSGFWSRFTFLFKMNRFDHIYIHREFTPLGPGILQRLALASFKGNVVFDFDDAIWMKNFSDGNKAFAWMKRHDNALFLMRKSQVNACGNRYLQNKAKEFNANSIFMPTTIRLDHHKHATQKPTDKIIVGWTGSHSTIKYLEEIVPQLKKAYANMPFTLRVISDIEPQIDFEALEFVRWNPKTEVEALLDMHIGLMPLPDENWTLGKCSLKALQYMATGTLALVSPVGANLDIVKDGESGVLVKEHEWAEKLEKSIAGFSDSGAIRQGAKNFVESHYSRKANLANFLALFAN